MKLISLVLLSLGLMLPAYGQAPDAFKSVAFLRGKWEAKTGSAASVAAAGTYSFGLELGGHIMARHSTSAAGCKGPATFDCEHGDLLYVFQDAPQQPLKAIYFDNEGHVIHYNVSTPYPAMATFLSDEAAPGPQFKLVYQLRGGVMSGKFQVKMPGQADWISYLEWSGKKVAD